MGTVWDVEKEYLSEIAEKICLEFLRIFEKSKNGIFIQFRGVTSGYSREPKVGSNERRESKV